MAVKTYVSSSDIFITVLFGWGNSTFLHSNHNVYNHHDTALYSREGEVSFRRPSYSNITILRHIAR